MQREKLEDFIKHCGSVEKAAKIIQITRGKLSAIRNGRNQMEVGSALLIAEYLNKCIGIKVNFLDLHSPY